MSEAVRRVVREEISSVLAGGVKIGTDSIYLRPTYIDMDGHNIINVGTVELGTSGVADVVMYRESDDKLKIDDDVHITGDLTVDGTYPSGGGTFNGGTITNNLTIDKTFPVMSFTTGGATKLELGFNTVDAYIISKAGNLRAKSDTGNIVLSNTILPEYGMTYDVGSDLYSFKDIYSKGSIIVGNLDWGGTVSPRLFCNDVGVFYNSISAKYGYSSSYPVGLAPGVDFDRHILAERDVFAAGAFFSNEGSIYLAAVHNPDANLSRAIGNTGGTVVLYHGSISGGDTLNLPYATLDVGYLKYNTVMLDVIDDISGSVTVTGNLTTTGDMNIDHSGTVYLRLRTAGVDRTVLYHNQTDGAVYSAVGNLILASASNTIVPNGNTQCVLGSPSFKWKNIYTSTLTADSLSGSVPLSSVTIDVDKNWNSKSITNISSLAVTDFITVTNYITCLGKVVGGSGGADGTEAFKVGDDAILFDVNEDGLFGIKGALDNTKAGFVFGYGRDVKLYRSTTGGYAHLRLQSPSGGGLVVEQNLSANAISATTTIGCSQVADVGSLKIGGTEVITSARVLQNVTANASIITSGELAEARIPHTLSSLLTLNAGLTVGSQQIIKLLNGSYEVRLVNPSSTEHGVLSIQNNLGDLGALNVSILKCDFINKATGTGAITLYNSLVPSGAVDLGSAGSPFNAFYVTSFSPSSINCSGAVLAGQGGGDDCFKVGDDMWIRDIDLANLVAFQGATNSNEAVLQLGINTDGVRLAHMLADADGVLRITNTSGGLGVLDVSFVYADHLNSASAGGITVYDSLLANATNINIGSGAKPFGAGYFYGCVQGAAIGEGNAFKIGNDAYLVDINEDGAFKVSGVINSSLGKVYLGGTDTYIYRQSAGVVGAVNISPVTDNAYNLGSGSYRWYGACIYNIYYGNLYDEWDEHDDIQLLRSIKGVEVTDRTGKKRRVHDPEAMKMFKADIEGNDNGELLDHGKLVGFLLSTIQKLAEKVEEQDKKISKLMAKVGVNA